ncbi:MAG: hypothetical protein U9N55_00430 [candidate division Zixibacteria bacterium]|nr:hypothetical protein [candidate division Zixibacteria bacterium]
MKTARTLVLTTTIIALVWSIASADQNLFGKSQRRSISYIDLLVKSNTKYNISSTNKRYYLSQVEKAVKQSRFDLNVLPEKYIQQFKSEAASKNLTLEKMDEQLKSTIVPHLLRVLDYYKKSRALPEVERERFIVVKAKEEGITADDLARVMNSAYIYMPFVESYEVKGDSSFKQVKLKGGVAWYHLVFEKNQPVVKFVGRDIAKFGSTASMKDTLDKKQRVSPLECAFREATRGLCKNLTVRVAERFPLQIPLEEIDGRWASFRLGKSEGIHIDDKYRVVQYFEDENGKLEEGRVGHLMVARVADNSNDKTKMSRGKGIIGGYETGMMALEHPRIGVDLTIGAALIPLKIDSMIVSTEYLSIDKDYSDGAYVGQASLQYNLAKTTGISQLFFNLQGSFGVASIDGKILGEDLPTATVLGYSAGISKKFYLSRLVVKLDASGIWQRISMKKTIDEVEYQYLIENFGARVGGGIEFVLGIDLNIGVSGYYRYMENNSFVDLKVDGEIPTWWSDKPYEDKITFDQEGFEGQVYVAYSLPSLPSLGL